jgi:hypothetical protein
MNVGFQKLRKNEKGQNWLMVMSFVLHELNEADVVVAYVF